ncbi:hypothetical protein [Anaeromyxobacter oryzae]|uniref:Cytochrome c domain-containing protein n=1 Tax=Anaeromyxobacter oryzae TaxID=2918170 RepID=A0ABM7WUW2_9BACT|nr:hypothetical protein [Anaeromyxobacter oryzae]BDG03235.1 hypothetical protein AMOR_22310 [Anaeromyxobacter oryzae]
MTTPPRIVAATPRARAALGYLHANCASCHDARGPLGTTLGLDLAQRVAAPASPGAPLPTASGVPSRFRPPGLAGREGVPLRIAPGDPAGSVLLRRLAAKDPTTRMPPLGRHLPDAAALELLAGFVRLDLAPARPDTPSPEAKQ